MSLSTRRWIAMAELHRMEPATGKALLDELDTHNVVRVTKHAAVRPDPRKRLIHKAVFDEIGESKMRLPMLLRLDEIRALMGLRPRYLEAFTAMCGGELISVSENLRTTAGIDFTTEALGKSVSRPNAADYIALSEDPAAPVAGDTVLGGEILVNGLQRAQSTFAHTGGQTTYTISHTFVPTSSFPAVQKEGVFNALVGGVLFIENTFLPTSLGALDQLTIVHSVSV